MNVLLVGSGGREHALAWKLSRSKHLENLYVAPGNAGTLQVGANVNIPVNDFESLGNFAIDTDIHMVVVGPEEPLVKGIEDYFLSRDELKHIPVIGPSARGAKLEGSKEFAKEFMEKHGIPTGKFKSFTSEQLEEGFEFLDTLEAPFVLKADGLAAGKGVLIIPDRAEAKRELEMMLQGKFGEASKVVVIEEYLDGIELSVFVLTDGENYLILPEAKDYKRVGEGDTGLNTGGMGAVSPVPFAGKEFLEKVEERVVRPTVKGLRDEGIRYKGFIFIGLMNVNGDPMVIEYNVRMGDPETEVVIPRLKNDLLEMFEAVAKGTLDEIVLDIDPRVVTTVMMVAGGYPGDYRKHLPISGLETVDGSLVFHAGTTIKDNKVVTNGGRVLAFSSWGDTMSLALANSYENISRVSFEDCYYRGDIGFDLLDS
jgi:phosphoribosylamine---glycine ligase